jgi:type IV conjugative transfer system lipoprotein TraV
MKKLTVLTLITVLTVLTSCSSNVKGSWSCPVIEGGKGSCVSIGDADGYQLSNNNSNLSATPEGYFDKQQKIQIKLIAPKLKDLKKLTIVPPLPQTNQVRSSSQLRTEEKVGKIWFAPYIDSDGNQHGENIIYVVDEKPKWISQK